MFAEEMDEQANSAWRKGRDLVWNKFFISLI